MPEDSPTPAPPTQPTTQPWTPSAALDPDWKPSTVAVAAGRPEHRPDAPLNVPIVMASTYVAGGDLEYGRYGNPTWAAFEDALGALEGGRCLSFASGLAAVATVLDLVGNDGLVVAPQHAYNGTVLQLADLESRGRLRTKLVDITDTDAVVAACADAALVWLESPTNPALELADIATIREGAHAAGAYVVVDNTFATPLLQKPLELDVDLVVHSATKYLSGHSDVLMGAVVTRDDELYTVLKGRRDLLAQGALAADLLTHKTKLWVHATSLGGVESTFERRRRWKSEPATIPEGLVRLSVGIEDVDDLWADLAKALDDLR
jgi:cystathionine gamma-synthase